uniref:Uncharacterized protein n=1 Tax=Arundo donax TaxID=35708 RepID=A0A0A9DGL2_ARUDO
MLLFMCINSSRCPTISKTRLEIATVFISATTPTNDIISIIFWALIMHLKLTHDSKTILNKVTLFFIGSNFFSCRLSVTWPKKHLQVSASTSAAR